MNSIFEIAKSGLFSAQKASATISHNIANANTPGYTRQRSALSAAVLKRNGYILRQGVDVETVQRLRNTLTDTQIMHKENDLGELNEQHRIYSQLEAVLTTDSGNGLDTQISNFFNAFADLANNPQDTNVRKVLISKAKSLIGTFRDTAGNLEDIARQTKKAAQSRVDEVNALLENLHNINGDIARYEAKGQPDLNGKDQQAQQLKALSKLVDVNAIYNDDGTVEVRIGGIAVLDGEGPSKISAETAPGENVFRLRLDNGKLITSGSGSLAADQHMITQGIPDMQEKLDAIAQSLVNEVNAIHSSGYGLNDNTQRSFFNNTDVTAQNISINQDLLQDAGNIAASSAIGEAGNSATASALHALQDSKILGGETLADNAIDMMSQTGNRIFELESQIETQKSAKQLLVNQQQSQTGVNIDEELSNLIKYQNAYQASARVLNTGQRMYDTLLSIL